MDSLAHLLEDPAYRHVVLNHLPITGLFLAWIVVAWSALLGQRSMARLGFVLVLATAGAAWIVVPSGDEAYTIVYETLDGPGKERLDAHADLAGQWAWLLTVDAVAAALALLTSLARPTLTRAAAGSLALLTVFSLATTLQIAEAGGKIRHGAIAHAPSAGEEAVAAPAAMRRLSATQLQRAIRDAFGEDIEIVGRFDPEVRQARLLAVGSGRMSLTPSGFERSEALAQSIAEQVLAEERLDRRPGCTPAPGTHRDDACTAEFIATIGEKLLRRPLDHQEISPRVKSAGRAAEQWQSFDKGLELALISLLVSPEFLFRVERVEESQADEAPLTADTWASRVSYLLWNGAPDAELSAALREGRLEDPAERARQVDRMLASPRMEDGARAFFADLLRFDEMEGTPKDPQRYTFWNRAIADDATEQTLRMVSDHLVSRDLGYSELFTSRRNFLTRSLGPVYASPVRAASGWEPVEFAAGHPRSGLLSHASFHILHSHPGRSSPTLRGAFLREALLCQAVPPAPADVEFALFNDDSNEELRTARDRLGAHATNGSCRSCHQLTDPLGLGLENFDGIGRWRTRENGAPIDPSGELDGVSFTNHAELGAAFALHPKLAPCLVTNVYRYAVGREEIAGEADLLEQLTIAFEENGQRWKPLLRTIALSEEFGTAATVNRPAVSSAQVGTNGEDA